MYIHLYMQMRKNIFQLIIRLLYVGKIVICWAKQMSNYRA